MIDSHLGPRAAHVYEELRRAIEAGRIGVGEPLPSQSALARQYGVALMTVRQAIARMESEGLVSARMGAGTFVASKLAKASTKPRDVDQGSTEEAELRASEERFRMVFERSASGIAISSAQGDFQETNEALQRFLGYSQDELQKMNFRQVTHPLDIEVSDDLLDELTDGRRQSFQIEKRYIRKDGSVVWGRLTTFLTHDAEGSTVAMAEVEDITPLKRAEYALRAAEARYEQLVNDVSDILWTGDLDGRLTSINAAAERITGYTKSEAKGMSIAQVVAPEHVSVVRRMLADKLAHGGKSVYQIEILTKDGRRVPVSVRSHLIEDAGAPVGVQGIARVETAADRPGDQ